MRVPTRRGELDVAVVGEGEPVLTIHGAFFAGTFDRLGEEQALRDHYKVINYARHGYGSSSKPQEPNSLQDITAQMLDVLRHVGFERAHVVGHSLGGMYALQFAMDHPEAVHTVAVIEPVLPTPAQAEFTIEHMMPAGQLARSGDSDTAFDRVFQPIYGSSEYRSEMGPEVPAGSFDQCVADLGYLFTFEAPAVQQFAFGPDEAIRVRQPLLILQGDSTEPLFVSNNQYLQELVPHAELRIVPGANHFCQVLNPGDTARALASFFSSHPIGETVAASDP
jgi:pimeloyl-ACP methyl ester carboxylesterase